MSGEQEGFIAWPEGVTLELEEKLHKASSKPDLPETILLIIEEGVEEKSPVSRLPSGEFNPEFVGYVSFVADMQSAFRLYRNEKARLQSVKSTLQLHHILEERFGVSARVITGKDPFDHPTQELEILREDPSGLSLALHLVDKDSGGDESQRRGAMAAADRYRTLHDLALGT